jgi:hypothetical protein
MVFISVPVVIVALVMAVHIFGTVLLMLAVIPVLNTGRETADDNQ